MSIFKNPAMAGFIRLCDDGWRQGWHERNGGNLTYRLTAEEEGACHPYWRATPGDWRPLGVTAPNLADACFIATGSGKYFRNVSAAPQDNLCVVQLNGAGDAWRVVWGLEAGGRPTSELPTHILNHSVRKQATDGACRVIYHAHTPSLIALTYVLPLTDRAFTRALWQSATECPVVFPGGVGVVPWMVPGGAEIALATAGLMQRYDAAVWAHHGLFCSGPDFDTTFGLMHTIEKAADIHVRALSCGQGIRQTIPDDGLRAIAQAFGVALNQDFLD
ncbi:MAG: rhamnulose-1-phosphate aldolase [Oscillospiraceae bacterium]|jgi:rhamnulose-1-phosphate aldolase|nr:rhamnulose-1-phosphate aldolase [Oscillospiraceae bacterium]